MWPVISAEESGEGYMLLSEKAEARGGRRVIGSAEERNEMK